MAPVPWSNPRELPRLPGLDKAHGACHRTHLMTTDADEVSRFDALAADWWQPDGPLRPLHLMNPTRIAWIRDQACRHFGRTPTARQPLAGLRVLDVGCGGGLVCEPLARLGALVTGIDPAPRNIAVAREHAARTGLDIDYRQATAEDLVVRRETFDCVLALEVIEHVADRQQFADELAALTGPGGLLVLSTLSRTLASLLQGILLAEYVLGWLPPGTHDWRRFLRPSELARMLRAHGLQPVAITGIAWDAARGRFITVRDPSVNYMLAAARP